MTPSLGNIPQRALHLLGDLAIGQADVAAHVLRQAIKVLALAPHAKNALQKRQLDLRCAGRHGTGERGLMRAREGHMSHGVTFQFCDEVRLHHFDM